MSIFLDKWGGQNKIELKIKLWKRLLTSKTILKKYNLIYREREGNAKNPARVSFKPITISWMKEVLSKTKMRKNMP